MRTGTELAGLAVISGAAGERLGRIQDVLFEPATGRISGFLVNPGGIFASSQLLPRLVVRSLGADATIVEGGTQLEEIRSDPPLPDAIRGRSLDNRPVIDESGKVLGKIADVVVDEASLNVAAFVVSTGLVENVLHGKPQLPMTQVRAIGADAVIVPTGFAFSTDEKA